MPLSLFPANAFPIRQRRRIEGRKRKKRQRGQVPQEPQQPPETAPQESGVSGPEAQPPLSHGPTAAAGQDHQSVLAGSSQPEPQSRSSGQPSNEPLPRPQRQRRRAKTDRGLPPDQELAKLAAQYLQWQRKLWPELVQAGLLPEATEPVLAAMVEDFKLRHRTGQVAPQTLLPFLSLGLKLAGNYNRYSCDNSSPTSILDQLVHGLDKARQEDRCIPWVYVFCDYSVSGLNSSRQGYSSYKVVLSQPEHHIETTYVDDFTRASRDEIEWWKLAYLSKRLHKRMVGASDGFDLSAVDWDVKITIYGLLSRLFIKGLREKVKRGMRGAARRRTCLGKLSLGFTRTVCRDEHGNVVCGPDGQPKYQPCIDPATAPDRRLLYELFVEKHWSAYRIARHFNQRRVDGWDGWTDQGVKKLLWSPASIGIFIWNRTRREYDWEAERWVVAVNPRRDWEVYRDPDLALVPMDLWRAARRRLAEMRRKSPLTGRLPSRNQKCATTLFSGTLFCAYCGQELKLIRSAGKYKVMGCLNGPTGKHGCQLTTSKSTRIVEKCLLRFLGERLLTEAAVEGLVAEANAFLLQEANKPRRNTAPLKTSIRTKEAAIQRLFQRIEGQAEEVLCQAYEKRIAELQKEVNQQKAELRQAEIENVPPPEPLDVVSVKPLLADLPALLNQEIPAAAEVLRALTGPIRIRQEAIPGKTRGARWIATFGPDLLALLRRVAKSKDCPDSITLVYLCQRIWITPEKVEVPVGHTPNYERIAGKAATLAAKGASVQTIAAALEVTWETARDALDFASTGHRPETKPSGKPMQKRDGPLKYVAFANEVVRLREEEQLSFKRIAERLNTTLGTVMRAYDHGHPEVVRDAAERGEAPKRGSYSHLGPVVSEQIRALLCAGRPPQEIAEAVGCGISTVYRVRRSMRATEGGGPNGG